MHNCAADATVFTVFPHMEKESICQLLTIRNNVITGDLSIQSLIG